jgi:hypothetical protein
VKRFFSEWGQKFRKLKITINNFREWINFSAGGFVWELYYNRRTRRAAAS